MTKAPERIWAEETIGGTYGVGQSSGEWYSTKFNDDRETEYIRADHALALVAAAYEDCWEQGKQAGRFAPDVPDDAQAALEARDQWIKQEARNEALREAAEAARSWYHNLGKGTPQDEILAMIKDQSDE